jgi:hypothetical protein
VSTLSHLVRVTEMTDVGRIADVLPVAADLVADLLLDKVPS